MAEYVIFGGTTEGREIAEIMQKHGRNAVVCVATEYGQELLANQSGLEIHTGRIAENEMADFIKNQNPHLVIDATHPYADKVSENIRAVCFKEKLQYIRIIRQKTKLSGCDVFEDTDELIGFLNMSDEIIFSTLGAKEASALRNVKKCQERIWLRILPSKESLALCAENGFPMRHLICMQGPFSEEMNIEMLKHTGAKILITKESGKAGGFEQKLSAAKKLGVKVAVVQRPEDVEGISVQEMEKRLRGGQL